ncbi:MAG: GNAT family N-acetyltransferase [Myxococcales bacterium]|nr:GNAT family N-acetyltransferase [Myxococcales bacterium]
MSQAPPITIRDARVEDADELVRIWMQRLPSGSVPSARQLDLFRAKLAPDPVFRTWVAESADTILGWTALGPNRASPALHDTVADWSLYVDAEHRRRGTGKQLAHHMLAFARTSPLEWIVGHIAVSNQAMYQLVVLQLGFRVMTTIPPSRRNPSREAVLMLALEV